MFKCFNVFKLTCDVQILKFNSVNVHAFNRSNYNKSTRFRSKHTIIPWI